jgi:proteasome lid subunit RPN8/RPN11
MLTELFQRTIFLIALVFFILILLVSNVFNNIKQKEYYGGHDQHKYTSIDDGIFHYLFDKDGGNTKNSKKKELSKKKDSINKISKNKWDDYTSWDDLMNDEKLWKKYLTTRYNLCKDFLFDWTEVLKATHHAVYNETNEYIGIIKLRNDNKTLYVDKMESANDETSTKSYLRSVPANLVRKYTDMPAAFIFHTHPSKLNADPFPSDADLVKATYNAYDRLFFGECVISEYGIFVYYLTDERFDKLMKIGKDLAFYTFQYDAMMSWNSIYSVEKFKLDDRLKMLNKFGIKMILIPSSLYISHNFSKVFYPYVVTDDKFIDTKYELLKAIEAQIKREEIKKSKE